MELVTFAQLKNLLNLEGSSVSEYPGLQALLSTVQSSFESYTGRLFDEEKRTVSQYVTRHQALFPLKGLPVKSIVSVTLDGVATTDYNVIEQGILLGGQVINAQVVIVYKGGLPDLPGDINRAALLQVAHEYQISDQLGASEVSTDGGVVRRPPVGLLPEVKRLLDGYVHPAKIF